jgi:hypothetical protein
MITDLGGGGALLAFVGLGATRRLADGLGLDDSEGDGLGIGGPDGDGPGAAESEPVAALSDGSTRVARTAGRSPSTAALTTTTRTATPAPLATIILRVLDRTVGTPCR